MSWKQQLSDQFQLQLSCQIKRLRDVCWESDVCAKAVLQFTECFQGHEAGKVVKFTNKGCEFINKENRCSIALPQRREGFNIWSMTGSQSSELVLPPRRVKRDSGTEDMGILTNRVYRSWFRRSWLTSNSTHAIL